MATQSLESRIAHVGSLTVCRHCSAVIQPDVVLCPCRVARGELPHTEWPKSMKSLLCVRTIERRLWKGTGEQGFWERMLTETVGGTTRGEGAAGRIIPVNVSVVDAFPWAAGEAGAWVAAGRPTIYTI